MHGVWILLFAVPFAGLVEKIPTAALAGLLIVVGIELLKPAHIETALRNGDLVVYLVTVVSVVFLNLLHGVMIGLALAVVMTGWRVVRARIEAKPVDDGWHVIVEGACTFLALPRLTGVLATVPERTSVTIHLLTNYLDHAAHQAISDWQRRHCATGGEVRLRDRVEVESIGHEGNPPKPHRRNAHLSLVAQLTAEKVHDAAPLGALPQVGGHPL
jgi:MFS superfamily sulfate permease-like transporter